MRLMEQAGKLPTQKAQQGVIQRDGTGLAGKKAVKSYVKGLTRARGEWDNLTILQRIDALMAPAMAQLEKVGVPLVRGMQDPFDRMGPDENAAFNRGLWQVWFNPATLGAGLSDVEFGRVANTVYHECRHAEQTFRVARKMAAEGFDATQISAEISIPRQIAEAAIAKPLKRKNKQEWEEANAWQLNMAKGGHDEAPAELVNAQKDTAIAEYRTARNNYRTLQQLFAHDPSADPQAQLLFDQHMQTEDGEARLREMLNNAKAEYIQKRERAKQAYLQYAQMPVEEDAWATGALVQKQLGLEPSLAQDELANLDDDEREMIPVIVVALSTGSDKERALLQFLSQ